MSLRKLVRRMSDGHARYLRPSGNDVTEVSANFIKISEMQKVLDELCAYTETGLSPDEVDQIRRASATMMFPTVGDFVRYSIQNFEELERYRRDEREGRIVRLPREEARGDA